MPLLAAEQPQADEVATQLRRIANAMVSVKALGTGGKAHPGLGDVSAHLKSIADALESGVKGRSVSANQISSIATHFEAIAAALRK